MVFHDQSESISGVIENMDYRLSAITDRKLVHCGPLIRKEEIYQYADLDERRKIFNSLYFFTLKAPVSVKTIVVDKKECEPSDELSLSTKLVKKLAFFIKENYAYFSDFVTINIYYDGGQKELAQIIHNTFQSLLSNVRFRRIIPDDYKLQQVADMFCTLMLLKLKSDRNELSVSERIFFGSNRLLRKNYLKILDRKAFFSE